MSRTSLGVLALLSLTACASNTKPQSAAVLPPPPVVTYSAAEAGQGRRIEHGELIVDVTEERKKLHAQHHAHGVLETRRLPPGFEAPGTDVVEDFALPTLPHSFKNLGDEVAELVVIFPTNAWEYDVLDYFRFAE